jgi:hypothetical protein
MTPHWLVLSVHIRRHPIDAGLGKRTQLRLHSSQRRLTQAYYLEPTAADTRKMRVFIQLQGTVN